jgi:hypothetical protein
MGRGTICSNKRCSHRLGLHTSATAKRWPLYAQDADAINTNNRKIYPKRGRRGQKNKFHSLITLISCIYIDMQTKLEPYNGSGKKVVVYNTYADKGRLHFDVFIPTDKSQPIQVPKEMDSKAVEYAKEFLGLIGKQPSSEEDDDLAVNMCERCHIDNTDLYASELWKLPGKEVFI